MFNILKKNKMDMKAAKTCWTWFEEREEWLIEQNSISGNDKHIWEIDKYLTPILPYVKRELEFMMGFDVQVGKWELVLFDFGDKNINKDYETLKSMMPKKYEEKWMITIEE